MARPPLAPQPAEPRHAARRQAGVALPSAIGRTEVRAVVRDCLERAPRPPVRLACDAGAVQPTLPAVDVVAKLALSARRNRRGFRLEHASPGLLELLDLCGLREVVTNGEGPGSR